MHYSDEPCLRTLARMSTTEQVQALDAERQFIAAAAELGSRIAGHSAKHDRDGTFVTEAYDEMRASGYLTLAVPTELGGQGATIRQVAMAQRELARHCASTALASTMHHHVVLFTAWRYRRGLPGAEATLRRVVDDGIVLVSTGGADTTRPRGEAKKVDGGFLVSGRKIFASQSPTGAVMSTMFPYDDPDEGRIVLNMAVPMSAEGVNVLDNWDAMGMRGTGSHDVEIKDVFIPEDKVIARRPYGRLDPPLQVIFSIALLPIVGRLPGCCRGGVRPCARGRRRDATCRRSDHPTSGRVDAYTVAGRRLGAGRRARRSSATTRHRRWTRSSR